MFLGHVGREKIYAGCQQRITMCWGWSRYQQNVGAGSDLIFHSPPPLWISYGIALTYCVLTFHTITKYILYLSVIISHPGIQKIGA